MLVIGLPLIAAAQLVIAQQLDPAWFPSEPIPYSAPQYTINPNWAWWGYRQADGPASPQSFPRTYRPAPVQPPAQNHAHYPSPGDRGDFNLPPPPGWTAAEFASTPLDSQSSIYGPPMPAARSALRSYKDGFFQKLSFSATWIDRGSTGFGVTDLQWYATVAVPMPTREWPLLISPMFQLHLFDGPATPELPAQVYDAQLELMWLPKINDAWQGVVVVAPGVYSDFSDYDSDAFRLTGKGLLRYQWIPERFEFLFGALYVNRGDVTWLPAGGFIWTPSENWRHEVLFPRPKLGYRVRCGDSWEDWVYLAGEFGGDTWSIENGMGGRDLVTLRDYRLLAGVERKRDGGGGIRLEAGYVFGRAIEFDSATPDVEPDDAVLLRGGLIY
jgi:hypothetical protein